MNELDLVVLATDLPEHALKAGDWCTVVASGKTGVRLRYSGIGRQARGGRLGISSRVPCMGR